MKVCAHIAPSNVNNALADLRANPVKGMTGRIDVEDCPLDLDDQGRPLALLGIEVAGKEAVVKRAQNLLTTRCSPFSPYGWSGTTLTEVPS